MSDVTNFKKPSLLEDVPTVVTNSSQSIEGDQIKRYEATIYDGPGPTVEIVGSTEIKTYLAPAEAKKYMKRVSVVTSEDHERIVAELKAEINGLKERLDVFRNREYEARNIEELKAEIAELQKTSPFGKMALEIGSLKDAIAQQALVISKLTEQRNWALTERGEYPEQAIASDDAEIAAIEKGEK